MVGILFAPGFDESFYRTQLDNENDGGDDALDHYFRRGWRRGLTPSSGFEGPGYIAAYPGLEKLGIPPLLQSST